MEIKVDVNKKRRSKEELTERELELLTGTLIWLGYENFEVTYETEVEDGNND